MMKKVLVVDDSPVDSKNLQRILLDAGCAVTMAVSGIDAIAKVHSDKPDLIMMDVNMPDLDGFGTARKLKQDADSKSIPIVFVTSKDQKVDRVFAQMLGAKGYVTKPYSADQILAQL
jgi:twitching motility two-component system response regulator PilH